MIRTTTSIPRTGRRELGAVQALPIIIVAAIIAVAVGIALLVGGDDEGVASSADFGPILVEGRSLAPIPDAGDDPAIGSVAPILIGLEPDGDQAEVGDAGGTTLIAFLAHWCPHCQAELPRLVELADEGALDGIDAVAVLTGSDPAAPNHPPVAWLEREGWAGRILLDDEEQTGALAYGLSSYPYLVLLDADGRIIARHAGEQGTEELREFLALAE